MTTEETVFEKTYMNYLEQIGEISFESHFSGKLNDLRKASAILAGYPAALEVNYDLAVQFDALPMIPVIMLYNDEDEEFPGNKRRKLGLFLSRHHLKN
ncbi:MAG: DUF3786 domain-containing protein [Desulfobacterales bacterium]|nr:MAG: DUF3786 domain-containing protein [Desulfobacterales bacterium]